MSKLITTQVSNQHYARERGVAIPASNQTIKLADGTAGGAIQIDLSKAMSPDRSYPAELAGAVFEKGAVKLIFGQEARSGSVRSMLEITMSPTAAVSLLNVVETLSPPLESLFQSTGDELPTLSEFNEDPPEVARLKANMFTLAFSGSDACIDFYYISPFSMARVQLSSTPTANVMGVVRIDIRTALVYALISKVSDLVSQFPTKIKELMEVKK